MGRAAVMSATGTGISAAAEAYRYHSRKHMHVHCRCIHMITTGVIVDVLQMLLLYTSLLLRKMVLQPVLVQPMLVRRLPLRVLRLVVDLFGRQEPPYICLISKKINKIDHDNFARISLTALFCLARGKIISEGGVKIGK